MENQNQNPKAQLIERLKQANNVLVTVSTNPSVDQLSAAIGLTLLLNQLDKHATAVFSGEVPNTLEFLKPEETLEKTTDSLRDFIISLDKAKADKLRYKVEDKMVKIFITPYRTSLSEADLIFGQGDFNVDVVVAIGVHEKEDLDQAITTHGRILHDAAVVTVNTSSSGQFGSINWVDGKASSLSEMLVPVCEGLKPGSLDAQMATAFLTGIVAETQRFSNEKTSSDTMNISAKLMAAGANQQLVASKLEERPAEQVSQATEQQTGQDNSIDSDGSLAINHENGTDEQSAELPEPQPEQAETPSEDEPEADQKDQEEDKPSRLILQPPTLGGTLTASSKDELDPSTDPMTLPPVTSPLLSHDKDDRSVEPVPEQPPQEQAPADEGVTQQPVEVQIPEPVSTPEPQPEVPVEVPAPATEEPAVPEPPAPQPAMPEEPADKQTLSELEEAVDSPHLDSVAGQGTPDAQAALEAAHQALNAADQPPEKPAAFNASAPFEVDHEEPVPATAPEPAAEETVAEPPPDIQIDPDTGNIMYPTNLVPPSGELPSDPTATVVTDPTAPPPVPPPMAMPPLMPPPSDQIDPNNLPPVSP